MKKKLRDLEKKKRKCKSDIRTYPEILTERQEQAEHEENDGEEKLKDIWRIL